jgi:hypothetical protein
MEAVGTHAIFVCVNVEDAKDRDYWSPFQTLQWKEKKGGAPDDDVFA